MPSKKIPRRKNSDAPHWKISAELLPELDNQVLHILENFPMLLERVWPLTRKHMASLPQDIRDLSAALTCERAELRRVYWHKPAWISAYLYYFLPWNLVRLCRLLPGLPLNGPEPRNGAVPLLLDAGAGPFTLPLALWICKPDWRERRISLLALDAAKQPLELGNALFKELAALTELPPWPAKYAVAPLESLTKYGQPKNENGEAVYPWLVTAANVLNELKSEKDNNENRLERLLLAWEPLWQAGGQLLFIEPGTRLGGTIVMRLREIALGLGLRPFSPCTHSGECPIFKSGRSGLSATWCHFIFSGQDAPQWLKRLSAKAGLFKTSLTLSPLLLGIGKPPVCKDGVECRVISQAFPAGDAIARYACSRMGLGLMANAKAPVSGSLCMAKIPINAARDPKSGALILDPSAQFPPSNKKADSTD